DFVERIAPHFDAPARPVRADGEAMRLVAQPLDEIKHRIARLQHEALAARHEEGLTAGIAFWTFGDGNERQLRHSQFSQRLKRGAQLSAPAVYENQIRPWAG